MINEDRKFIMLQEDDKGYGVNSKRPTGYTKIEPKNFKNRIFYFIQNLNNDNTYILGLIVRNDSKIEILSIGEVKPDNNGKIDVSYDFDDTLSEALCGSTIFLKDTKGNIKYPLSGFLTNKKLFNWKVNSFRSVKSKPFRRENFSFDKKKDKVKKEILDMNEPNDKLEDNLPKEDKKPEDLKNKEPLKEEINIIKEDIPEGDMHDNEEGISKYKSQKGGSLMEKHKSEVALREDKKQSKKTHNNYKKYEEEIKSDIKDSVNVIKKIKEHINSLKDIAHENNGEFEGLIKGLISSIFKIRNEVEPDYNYRFFFNILNEFEEMESLNQDNYRFFRVDVDNFSQMENIRKIDNVKYSIVYHPMMFMYPYFRDKGYFVIGLNYDGNGTSNLVYGIEADETNKDNLPYDGRTGFRNYIYDYENSKIYSIMEYDYKKFEVK